MSYPKDMLVYLLVRDRDVLESTATYPMLVSNALQSSWYTRVDGTRGCNVLFVVSSEVYQK
jgi:hypothetical protein